MTAPNDPTFVWSAGLDAFLDSLGPLATPQEIARCVAAEFGIERVMEIGRHMQRLMDEAD